MDAVGQHIRELRQERDWTLKGLADRCELSTSFISQVERGLCSISIASLHTICQALEVKLADFFAEAGEYLIIEFVPKGDSQVQRLLSTREDVFSDYHLEGFEAAFTQRFAVLEKEAIAGSERTLYLLQKK